MKKLFLLLLGLLIVIPVYSYSFTYEYQGRELIFKVISEQEKTCMVTRSLDYTSFSGDVVIPSSVLHGSVEYQVTAIDNFTFFKCKNITSIILPNTITSIGGYAFADCASVTYIDIPPAVTSILKWAFADCKQLTSIEIPESITTIEEATFVGCRSLTSVVIPSSVTKIGDDAFSYCRGLVSVDIPESVVVIGNSAFLQCENLISLNIPNSVTTIGGKAFCYCDRLTSVDIPPSVTEIGVMAFALCGSLRDIDVDKNNPAYTSIDGVLFNRDVTTLVQYPFARSGEYRIPDSVIAIGDAAFFNSIGVTSVILPENLVSIGESALFGTGLTTVNIPATVTEISPYAFYECFELKSVYYDAVEPREFEPNFFRDSRYTDATLYVPAVAVEQCRRITPWMYFNNIRAFDFNGVDGIVADSGDTSSCEIFTLGGVRVTGSIGTLASGIYIVRQGENIKKMVVE